MQAEAIRNLYRCVSQGNGANVKYIDGGGAFQVVEDLLIGCDIGKAAAGEESELLGSQPCVKERGRRDGRQSCHLPLFSVIAPKRVHN